MPHLCILWREVGLTGDRAALELARADHSYSSSSLVVLDPSHLESLLSQGTITLTLNSQQEICVLTKSGGVPLSADDIMKTVMLGIQVVKEVDAKIKRALEKEAKRRVIEVR